MIIMKVSNKMIFTFCKMFHENPLDSKDDWIKLDGLYKKYFPECNEEERRTVAYVSARIMREERDTFFATLIAMYPDEYKDLIAGKWLYWVALPSLLVQCILFLGSLMRHHYIMAAVNAIGMLLNIYVLFGSYGKLCLNAFANKIRKEFEIEMNEIKEKALLQGAGNET